MHNKKSDTWEIGTKLLTLVKAGNSDAAKNMFFDLIVVLEQECSDCEFVELKMRILQVLTNINRAAYVSGASPKELVEINLNLIHEIIPIKSKKKLLTLAQSTFESTIALVPERDIYVNNKIETAIKYIKENAHHDISRDEVAEVLDCSPSHLSRLFSNHFGINFKNVVLKYRMEKAKKILESDFDTITRIAFKLGFKDPNYFIATFKRVIGISPGQYRKSIREKAD